ncbi:uncharacterized protein LOC121543714 isoform X2 [Coregonus clupeaformis]|uniref:uncharacterized protein LOC121543714 isoform X2 n=1 Tax=Coregonus clupeaformis TaxID=59861 RepID=UPI001BE02BDE|nr:uncharacterized protein LOC121543714 isoform X2 [Coregonus clupeaformis]
MANDGGSASFHGDWIQIGREDLVSASEQTSLNSSRCSTERVISSVPQYVEAGLVSGHCIPPSQPRENTLNPGQVLHLSGIGPSTPVNVTSTNYSKSHRAEHYEVFDDNFLSIDHEGCSTKGNDEDNDVGPSSSNNPHSSHEYLLHLKQQAGSHLRAQKERHVKDLSLKKDKLQHLLLKLDTMKGPPEQDTRRQYSSERDEPMGESGEDDRAPASPGNKQREAAGERTANNHMEDGPVQMLPHNRESMSPEDGDACDHALHRGNKMIHSCWRRIFQSISFPFSLATAFIIELLSFITQYVIKVLIVGLVVVLGEQVITPLFGALFSHALQPMARCLINVSWAVRDILHPLLAIVREVFMHVTLLVRSFRLVEVNMATAEPRCSQDV